tara:strand:- start:510 stop:881 length:372 start_codon:yes stop_codon:yes gene_type:complete
MQYDMNGNIVPDEVIETDRKFYMVQVDIVSTVWESGYHIYEADSPEDAFKRYQSDEQPYAIEYTGHVDQDYKYDEYDGDEETLDGVEEIDNKTYEVQDILRQEKAREKWLAEQAEKERRSKLI